LTLITEANCGVTACNDDKVEPIPWIPQVGVFVEGEAFRDNLDEHLDGINYEKEEFSFLEWLTFREENAIKQNSCHNEIIEKLIGCYEHADSSQRVPGRKQEQAFRAGKSMDVVLLESLRDDTECLKIKIKNNEIFECPNGYTETRLAPPQPSPPFPLFGLFSVFFFSIV
jgi:hypothetical protein